MRNKVTNSVLGIIFIGAGIGFLGNAMDWWNFNLFFDGWWTLFIIIPCVVSIINNGFSTGSIIGLGIGVILLLAAQDIFRFQNIWKLIVPLILVCIGLSILFNGFINRDFANRISMRLPQQTPQEGVPNFTAFFGGNTPNFVNQPFIGCNTSAIFGGIELDLRNAIISEDCVITATALFGGMDLIFPYNVNVKVNCTPIFGGVENKAVPSADPLAPTVYINATCIFGGIDIK